ncbi:undecaprenyl diphosphate synthase family protein [Clostridium sp.]|uniref:undecaprenyl diphosphate synthase family protein n=1 Tax=Clostridium sp. TaxID=1506 RepID=UPI003216A82B
MRVPNHIGVIPDGNRRWAQEKGLSKQSGYISGIDPGLILFKQCKAAGVKEVTFYGFTTDNAKRPVPQKEAFIDACIKAVKLIAMEDAEILVIGNTNTDLFPEILLPYTKRKICGKGGIKVNFLINYSWKRDLDFLKESHGGTSNLINEIESNEISRVDLIIRWGGRRRLSGFLPVQSVYADFYVIDDFWPDFKPQHFEEALLWYQQQDVTLGG